MSAKRPFRLPDYRRYTGERGSPGQWQSAFRDRMGLPAARAAVGSDSPYAILGVAPGALWDAVKKAYRRLVLQHHPDRGGDPAQFRRVQAAFEILEAEYGR